MPVTFSMKRKNRSSLKSNKNKKSDKLGTQSRANQNKSKITDSIPTLTEKVFLSPKTLSSQSRLSLPRKTSAPIPKGTETISKSDTQDSTTNTLSQNLQNQSSVKKNNAKLAEQLQTPTDKMPAPSNIIENFTESPNLAPTLMALPKTFEPQPIEKRWYQAWQSAGYFEPNITQGTDKKDSSYCIMLPPPNITGTLHMGHAFQHTIMDALTRYHRMLGDNTLWQPGTDHAGIATQIVVERQLEGQNIDRHDLGRQEFINRVWQWKEQSGSTITRQMKRLGTSCDWSRERFTMDEGLSRAVQKYLCDFTRKA